MNVFVSTIILMSDTNLTNLAAGLNFARVYDLLERWVVFVLGVVFRPVRDAGKLNDAFLLRCRGPQIVGLVVSTLCQEVGVLVNVVTVED